MGQRTRGEPKEEGGHNIGSNPVTICLNCGDEGFTNAYVYCCKCLEVAVHRYCLDEVTFKEFVYWVCDDCEVKDPVEVNTGAISLEDGNSTSSRHCKASSEAKMDVPESILKSPQGMRQQCAGTELVEHCKLVGDTPRMKMSKKSKPSLRDEKYEQRLYRSSEQSNESHTSIECNERTQPGTHGDSSSMTEKRMSILPSGNHHENESILGKDGRFTSQSTTVNGDPSQFFKGEVVPNVPKHCDQERAKPLNDPIWRGSFNIWNKDYETLDLVAHLSVKACQKVFDEASLFAPSLQLEMLPKSDVWPKSFITSEPNDDHIALYFFPSDTSWEKEFDLLVEQMIKDELALRATVTNAELLVFTSTELPLLYWRFQGKYYLWGVFRAKRDSTGHPVMPNGSNKFAIHPTLGNAKTSDVQSPRSPLSNNPSLGSCT